jgi:hypothetical protein
MPNVLSLDPHTPLVRLRSSGAYPPIRFWHSLFWKPLSAPVSRFLRLAVLTNPLHHFKYEPLRLKVIF